MATVECVSRLQSSDQLLSHRHAKVGEAWRDSVAQRFDSEHWLPIRDNIATFNAHANNAAQRLRDIERRLP